MRLADRRKALIVVLGSLLVTGGLVALVLSLGSWAYQTRRFLLHERRLNKALQEHPTASDISKALLAEADTLELDVPPAEADLRVFVARWSPWKVEEVLTKRRAARELRVFAVADMVYFLFFDADGRFQAYVLMASDSSGTVIWLRVSKPSGS